MTSLAYGLDMPYEVQLEHDAAIAPNYMSILEPQRSPNMHATRHRLTTGVHMVSLSYNGAGAATLQHLGGGITNTVSVPTGTAGTPRTSAPIKISVQGTNEYLRVFTPSADGEARGTISVIPAATFDEMAESAQGVSVLSEISNLKTTKADKSTLDARVPENTSLRLDTTVGTRVFAGNTMIYGDTGWRVLPDPPGISEGSIHIRRINNQTIISFNRVGLPNIAGSTFLVVAPSGYVPLGFRPKAYDDRPTAIMQGVYAQYQGMVNVNQQSMLHYKSIPGKDDIGTGVAAGSCELSYICQTGWPTTLPGTPV